MSPMGQKQTYAAHKLMSALPPKADINASVYRPCWLLPPIIAVIGGYASRPLLHLSRSAVGELFLLEVVFRQVAINELANHRGQRICFGIAAIDGHYAHVVCAFEHTRPLLSHGLVIGKHPQNTLVCPLVHTSRFDRDGAVCAP